MNKNNKTPRDFSWGLYKKQQDESDWDEITKEKNSYSKITQLLCFLGWHKWWEMVVPNSNRNYQRKCMRCPKQQYWWSAGFPGYDAEWRDVK